MGIDKSRFTVKPVSIDFINIRIFDSFWEPRISTNRRITIPLGFRQCRRTGRIDAWKMNWKEGDPGKPHIFWDSDVAKWMEAASNSIALFPDDDLGNNLDYVIDLMEKAQQADGYLNIYFTIVEPEKRWTNLRDKHELYCAGHLIEAAIAHNNATGSRKFLDILCRYADCIHSNFGPGTDQKCGYPGHEELELALVKLFRATEKKHYLDLARFFIDERGRQPHYFDLESAERREKPQSDYRYWQAHLPVRMQKTAEGHSVRAMYLYCGMTDIAAETGDETLACACRQLWRDVVDHKMYITGGVGSSERGERFTCNYDLPNETAYAETCAAIGLVFWAQRMLCLEPKAEYADVMERSLYNCVLSGVSLGGNKFFYANPLAVRARVLPDSHGKSSYIMPTRQEWFDCSCCPTNIMRLLSSLGRYIYSILENRGIYIHLYLGNTLETVISGIPVTIRQGTEYPWKESVSISIEPLEPVEFFLFLRKPGWSRQFSVRVNGKPFEVESAEDGYMRINRLWRKGDNVELILPMPVEEMEAHPLVTENCGRIAIQRGPLVYCIEEVDNGGNLDDICLNTCTDFKAEYEDDILGGLVVITGNAWRREKKEWEGHLYRPAGTARIPVKIKAVPYCLWNNRDQGEMLVWIRKDTEG